VGWQETSVVDERLQFIEECKSQEWSIAEVCRRFEVSRKTGYKWLARYETEGLDGLNDRSHAPHHNPRQVLEEVEQAVVEARGKHSHWGPVKLRSWLKCRESTGQRRHPTASRYSMPKGQIWFGVPILKGGFAVRMGPAAMH